MTRGKRPVVAIGEAKRNAVAAGFILAEVVTETEIPFDFVVQKERITSLVRVRRLKQAGFRVANILRACAQQIADLRSCTLPDQLVRELWVRGPARAFHRYRVSRDTVEEIGIAAILRSPESGADPVQPNHKQPEPPEYNSPAVSVKPAEDRVPPGSAVLIRLFPYGAEPETFR